MDIATLDEARELLTSIERIQTRIKQWGNYTKSGMGFENDEVTDGMFEILRGGATDKLTDTLDKLEVKFKQL